MIMSIYRDNLSRDALLWRFLLPSTWAFIFSALIYTGFDWDTQRWMLDIFSNTLSALFKCFALSFMMISVLEILLTHVLKKKSIVTRALSSLSRYILPKFLGSSICVVAFYGSLAIFCLFFSLLDYRIIPFVVSSLYCVLFFLYIIYVAFLCIVDFPGKQKEYAAYFDKMGTRLLLATIALTIVVMVV